MFKIKQVVMGAIYAAAVTALLAACSSAPVGGVNPTPLPTSTPPPEVIPAGGNPIPTPIIGENVGTAPDSQAAAVPEESFKRYINDSIAGLVAIQVQKITIRQRYQNPSQTEQDLGGLLTAVNILEDRTKIKKVTDTSTNATANADIDVRITWADGDTQSFTCKYAVTLQAAENANRETVWYVINPDVFPIFANGVCLQK